MIRMTKPGGWVAFTCASRGRLEHGTDRSDANLSPGTSSLGWNYYRNLQESDFVGRRDLSKDFAIFKFYYMPTSDDLYFFGFKRKEGEQPKIELAAFEREVARIRLLDRERVKNYGVLKRMARKMYKMPLSVVAVFVDDKKYQNFALAYAKVGMKVTQLGGWER